MQAELFWWDADDTKQPKPPHTHRMADTSIQAYRNITPNKLGAMQRLICTIIAEHPYSSNGDILNILNQQHPRKNGRAWRICSVTGRVKELREQGYVIQIGYKTDPESGQRVKCWGCI